MIKYHKTKDQNNVYLEVDLKELFGQSVSQRAIVEKLGQEIIDKIISRTESGIDAQGRKLKAPYSPEYSKSLKFQAYGKSKNKINMTLTGSMLNSLEVLDLSPDKIKIGWESGDEDGEKAHGHITGNVGVRRDFFGLPKSELLKIKRDFENEIKDDKEESFSDLLKLALLDDLRGASLVESEIKGGLSLTAFKKILDDLI